MVQQYFKKEKYLIFKNNWQILLVIAKKIWITTTNSHVKMAKVNFEYINYNRCNDSFIFLIVFGEQEQIF
ncbi:MAG: hypothetical protein JWM28_1011 [Chitinophagaceae bacterium]|nr:hypothetical protein [Chitinophagaceae bacterium]